MQCNQREITYIFLSPIRTFFLARMTCLLAEPLAVRLLTGLPMPRPSRSRRSSCGGGSSRRTSRPTAPPHPPRSKRCWRSVTASASRVGGRRRWCERSDLLTRLDADVFVPPNAEAPCMRMWPSRFAFRLQPRVHMSICPYVHFHVHVHVCCPAQPYVYRCGCTSCATRAASGTARHTRSPAARSSSSR